jgi:hypothetical protein
MPHAICAKQTVADKRRPIPIYSRAIVLITVSFNFHPSTSNGIVAVKRGLKKEPLVSLGADPAGANTRAPL